MGIGRSIMRRYEHHPIFAIMAIHHAVQGVEAQREQKCHPDDEITRGFTATEPKPGEDDQIHDPPDEKVEKRSEQKEPNALTDLL